MISALMRSSVNKFNRHTLEELRNAVDLLAKSDAKGLVFTSAKSGFIVGADITEFTGIFGGSEESIVAWLVEANEVGVLEDWVVCCKSFEAVTWLWLGCVLAL